MTHKCARLLECGFHMQIYRSLPLSLFPSLPPLLFSVIQEQLEREHKRQGEANKQTQNSKKLDKLNKAVVQNHKVCDTTYVPPSPSQPVAPVAPPALESSPIFCVPAGGSLEIEEVQAEVQKTAACSAPCFFHATSCSKVEQTAFGIPPSPPLPRCEASKVPPSILLPLGSAAKLGSSKHTITAKVTQDS